MWEELNKVQGTSQITSDLTFNSDTIIYQGTTSNELLNIFDYWVLYPWNTVLTACKVYTENLNQKASHLSKC